VVKLLVFTAALVFAGRMACAAPTLSGLGSWYGTRHEQGRLTASGCPFDAGHVSAASPVMPIGAWVRVTHGKRSLVLRIEDRGPYVRGRIIDLSRAAAEKLDMIAAGVVRMDLEVIRLDPMVYGQCSTPTSLRLREPTRLAL
jgi:rare lipoprotein A